MSILIKNCRLISMSEKRNKIEDDIDILIEGNTISKIGKNIEYNGKVINANGKIVMPGLINTHSHIGMSIFRETVDGMKTQDWLEKEIWPREDKLTREDIYWASKLSCIEMIKTGTTTINDMYFFTDEIIKAALETGVRLQATRALLGKGNQDFSRLNELEELVNKYNEETITFNVGIHGLYTCDEQYVENCIEFARKKELLTHIHFCENAGERKQIIEEYNVKTPAEVIKMKFNKIHTILAHAVKITEEDIEILKDENVYISHCPISNLKLGCGIAPITKMIENGICVSLGTDGQGSGSNLDMFETMKFTALLQKGINEDPKILPAYEVIKMATINGAKALGLENNIGTIEEGKKADIIIVNIDDVVTKPTNDIFSQIVYNVKGNNVDTTIVNGNILMENEKLKINKNETIEQCDKIVEKWYNK